MNSFFYLDDSTVALTSVGDGDAVVEGVHGRLLLLFPLVLVQHPLAEEGEQVEDEATADDQRDDQDPVLPLHGNDDQRRYLERETNIVKY